MKNAVTADCDEVLDFSINEIANKEPTIWNLKDFSRCEAGNRGRILADVIAEYKPDY